MRLLYKLSVHEFANRDVEGVAVCDRLFIYWRRPMQVWWRSRLVLGRRWWR